MHVLVDYAHKPDALEKVLNTLGDLKGTHRLITVFGCGGDRDRLKRPVMGRIAVECSDHVFVTSDNPRTEKPEAIIQEILVGTAGHANLTVEPDRKKAICAALQMARSGDVVVIAGKGHEDYQILADPQQPRKTVKIHFDDREVAAEALLGC
jgi:UDP-N-acetylmuramoyl-L-alanyl-D-glutamate--2,6-diaminopimelate ligase